MSFVALMLAFFTASATAQTFQLGAGAAPASVQESCQLGEAMVATATFNAVTINGQTHPVRGRKNRDRFTSMLLQCGHHDAAIHFDKWRFNRRMTNTTAGLGALVYAPVLLATPVAAINAGLKKQKMLAALNLTAQAPVALTAPSQAGHLLQVPPASTNPFAPAPTSGNPFVLVQDGEDD